jgi:hypothetical protein
MERRELVMAADPSEAGRAWHVDGVVRRRRGRGAGPPWVRPSAGVRHVHGAGAWRKCLRSITGPGPASSFSPVPHPAVRCPGAHPGHPPCPCLTPTRKGAGSPLLELNDVHTHVCRRPRSRLHPARRPHHDPRPDLAALRVSAGHEAGRRCPPVLVNPGWAALSAPPQPAATPRWSNTCWTLAHCVSSLRQLTQSPGEFRTRRSSRRCRRHNPVASAAAAIDAPLSPRPVHVGQGEMFIRRRGPPADHLI